MQQDQEITRFLGDFMGNDGQGGNDAQGRAFHEGGGDEHTIDEVVKGVAHQDEQATAAVVVSLGDGVPVMVVTVPVTALVMAVTP